MKQDEATIECPRLTRKRHTFMVVAMVAAAHAVNHANVALMPILYPAIMANLHFDYSQLGLLLSISRIFGQGFQWLAGYMGQFFKRKTLLGFGAIFQGIFMGLSTINTGLLYTSMLLGSIVGPALAGVISDRVPQRKFVLVTSYLGSTALTILFIHAGHSSWSLPVVLFVLGCFVYAESPLLQSLAADSTEELPKDMVFGVYFTIGFGSGALWVFLLGLVVEEFGFLPAFYIMATSYMMGALWIFLLKSGGAAAPAKA